MVGNVGFMLLVVVLILVIIVGISMIPRINKVRSTANEWQVEMRKLNESIHSDRMNALNRLITLQEQEVKNQERIITLLDKKSGGE